jgi:phosphatidyl-myo-inositol alpha-mannosyltransferase
VLETGQAGVLFPVGDADALAGELVRLLDDPAERVRLGERARAAVAPYDWAVIARRVFEVYSLAVEATPRSTRTR